MSVDPYFIDLHKFSLARFRETLEMADMARIVGVRPVFALIFLDGGVDGLDKLPESPAEPLFERLLTVNREKGYSKIMATLKDVHWCIQLAGELPRAIEY